MCGFIRGVLYPFLAIATNMPYLALMMPFLLAYYSLSSIAMDDKCQWFRYARTLPVPVQAQVGAKYLIVVTSSGIGLVWCLVTGGLHVLIKPHTVDWVGDYLLSGIVCCGTALLVMAVLLPVAFKKGVEKARNWMIVLWLALFGGFYLLAKFVVCFISPPLIFKIQPDKTQTQPQKPSLVRKPFEAVFFDTSVQSSFPA